MNHSSSITSHNIAVEAAEASNSSVLLTNLASGLMLATIAGAMLMVIAKLVA